MSQIINSALYRLRLNFISLIQIEYSDGSFRWGQWGSYFDLDFVFESFKSHSFSQ